jgi:ComF family protein
MGEFLCEEVARRPLQADIVVPVPLAAGRQRQRGYNQATLLAERVASAVGATLAPDALTRRGRPPQSTLKAPDRLSNLADVFACAHQADVLAKRVLLVDDVVTTGATISACADTLAEAGAKRISVLAFARDL